MKNGTRILIVDRNRYHALLLDREIHHQIDSAVTTVFRNLTDAAEELRQNNYAVVVVDYSLLQEAGVELSELTGSTTPEPATILAVSPGGIPPEIAPEKRSRTTVVVKDSTFHLQIPPLIEYIERQGSFLRNGRPIRPRLSVRRKADMINITAGTLAHEINNPLMTILGVSELILSNGVDCPPEVFDKVKVIQKSARRIGAVLSHLASLSEPNFRATAVGNYIDTPVTRASE
jgi:signal transduction histidine kinase